jgi:dethiobiotin synthetase
MKNKAIFVTATGTDVGKTYISGLLVKKMRDYGLDCGYYKPALSGAIRQPDGSLLAGDCDFVLKTSGLNAKQDDCVTYCFEEAVSPHLAAERQGVRIKKEVIKSNFDKLSEKYEFLVVEGAGGITCPFNLKEEILLLPEIIKALGTDALVVADGGLGTINYVLLTIDYAKSHGINVRGIILNNYDKNDFMHQDNKLQVERLTGVKVIATVGKNEKDINITKEDLLKVFDK